MAAHTKDAWDYAEIIGKLTLPLVVAVAGFVINTTLNQAKESEQDTRVYTELMTKREQADVTLRQGMFESVMKTFLESQPGSAERDLLNLELLVHNFNETLNLKPLFRHVDERIHMSKTNVDALEARLIELATEVSDQELRILSESGAIAKLDFDYDPATKKWTGAKTGLASIENHETGLEPASPGATDRRFSLHLMDADSGAKQLRLWLQVFAPGAEGRREVNVTFDAGYFDFPMVQNIRLSHGQRCAVVVTELSESVARVSLAFFPGSRASLKEKPYYDEMLDELLHARKGLKNQH